MPKTLRWIGMTSLLLLLLMTLARLAVYYRFRLPVTGSDSIGPALWLGFRFDFRLLASLGLFVGLLVGVIIIVGGLTFFPALELGPIAEHLAMNANTLY